MTVALSASEVSPFVDFPRDLYLNAEDILKAKPGTSENDLAIIRNGRFGAFRHVHAKAEDFSAAVKALKAFDRTGNIGGALGHLEDTFHDLQAVTRNLITDIEAAENRYQEASIVWPAPALADDDKPDIRLDGVPGPTPADVAAQISAHAAFDRAAAAYKAGR